MAVKKPTNPFYVAALPVGVLFALTACAFVVMTMQGADPQRPAEIGLVALMAKHGVAIMVGELAVLGTLTIAAIATDDLWTRRFEAAQARQANASSPVPDHSRRA